MYRFRCISAHQGPFTSDSDCNGSTYNVLVENLREKRLHICPWISLPKMIQCCVVGMFLAYQTNLKSYQQESFWKFVILVPGTHGQAVEIDIASDDRK
jgi:hypothetical protein